MADQLGPCQIEFDATSIGETLGGVTLNITENVAEIKSDQKGDTVKDERVVGISVSISAALSDISLDHLATLFKTTKVTDATDPTKEKVVVSSTVNKSLASNGKKLVLKPIIDGVATSDANLWITFPNANFKVTASAAFNSSDQRVYAFEAKAYPDSNNQVIIFGDETATAS